MCCNYSGRGKSWITWAIFIPLAVIAGLFIFGNVIMYLWNALLPNLFGISTITFWQALGILVLSKILFSGFHHDHNSHKCHDWEYSDIRNKWMKMTPEQREEFRKNWHSWSEGSEKEK